MTHHHFTVEELMLDDSFANYCLKRKEEDISKWETIINSHPHSGAIFSEAEQLVQLLHSGLTEKEVDAELQKIQSKILQWQTPAEAGREDGATEPIASQEKKPANRIWLYAGIAASLLACMFLFFGNDNKEASQGLQSTAAKVFSQPDSRKSVRLPDGTEVYLNGNSSLGWNASYNVSDRQISLTGSAFFKVAKNAQKPFVVHSGAIATTALGTAFYVRQPPSGSNIEVSLLEGKINIQEKGSDSRNIVYPGEEMVYSLASRSFQKQKFDTALLNNWLAGNLSFTNMKLQDVINELSFWYNARIELNNTSLADKPMTGSYRNAPLQDVLKVMSFSLGFTYTTNGNTIIIH